MKLSGMGIPEISVIAMTLAVPLVIIVLIVVFLVLGIKALRKYLRAAPVREEKAATRATLGETLRERRVACKMTQEFVAETIGVSRQAVSKWESGCADPSTSNLLALARLYQVPAEELLRASANGSNAPKDSATDARL